MSIEFTCPCGSHLRVNDTLAGRQVKCPRCGNATAVPDSSVAHEACGLPELAEAPARRESPGYRSTPMRVTPPGDEFTATEEEASSPDLRPAPPRVKKSRRLVLFLSCGVLLVFLLVLLAVGGGLAWYFFLRPAGMSDELTYLPDNFEYVASAKVSTILGSEYYTALKKELDSSNPELETQLRTMEKQFGVDRNNIDRVTVAGRIPRPKEHGDPEFMVVVKALKKIDLGDLFKDDPKFEDSDIGKYKMRIFTTKKMAVCVPDSKTILFSSPEMMTRVLRRDKKADMTQGMKDAMKSADFSEAAAAVFSVQDFWKDTLRESDPSNALFGGAISPEQLTQFADHGFIQFRLGSKVEMEAQLLGTDSKVMYSFSIKTKTLIDLINTSSKPKPPQNFPGRQPSKGSR
jgi:hypothetical protein